MDRLSKWVLLGTIMLATNTVVFSQQLKLGKNPSSVVKSAVLELESPNQGLLFPRILDSSLINTLNPPDGMVVFHIPSLQLLLRSGGSWKPLTVSLNTSNVWSQGGNTVLSIKKLGTIDAFDLPIITNNTEKMRISTNGSVGIGETSLDGTEKLVVSGGTSVANLVAARTNINNTAQVSVQNISSGTLSNSNFSALSNAATSTTNFINFGINSSGYNYVTNPILNGANNAYLYSTGNDFIIGNATATRPIRFFAGGYANSNERMRIDGTNGYIGISNTGPTEKLDITGNLRLSGAFMPNNLPGTTGFLLQSNGAGAAPTWIDSSPYLNSWRLGGNSVLANTLFGTINNFDVQFITNNIEKMRLTGTGFLGIGTSAPTNTLHVVGTNPLALTGLVTGTSLGTDSLLSITAGVVKKLPMTTFINNANTWSTVGNTGTTSGSNYLGTSTPQSLVLRTNGVQGIILDSIGNVGIGSAPIFTLTPNREKLLVDAGLNADNAFINVISGKASTNNYVQMNIQNRASGTSASSDVVATNDLGSETVNFIDMGINSSSFATGTITGAPHTAYLYATGNDFVIGNSTTGRPLRFYTTAGGINADAMRIDSAGRVGIGNIPTQKLDITGNLKFSGTLMPNNNAGLTGMFLQSMGPSAAPQWSDASSSAWQMTGNAGTTSGSNYLGTSTPQSFVMRTAGVQGIILDSLGNVGIGAAPIFTLTPNREKLLVDAGTIAANSFVNVISGKANTNSYVQVNIQNRSSGTAASSDIVATNNTGSETTNFIDMGINSTGNSSAGMLGGANTAYLFSTGADLVIGNSTNNNVIKFYTTFSNTETERMRLINTGLMPGGTGVHDLGGTANRWGTVYSANAANVSSDKRLKTNIENLPYGLKEVLALRPVSYNWKTTPNSNKMLGLIAQEARKIVPEIVVGDETKEMLSMKYDELIPVLINAIKEQQKQIDELKQQIKLLQK